MVAADKYVYCSVFTCVNGGESNKTTLNVSVSCIAQYQKECHNACTGQSLYVTNVKDEPTNLPNSKVTIRKNAELFVD